MPKTLRPGSRGPEVVKLQQLLGLKADGVYGSKTRAAVRTFRVAVGLGSGGICGPKTWRALLAGESSPAPTSPSTPMSSGKFGKPKDYKQAAKPWGPKMYSSRGDKKQTYANSACGPTAAADVVYSMRDASVTPETLGKIAVAKGYRTANNGTAWGFFAYIAKLFGFRQFAQTKSLATLKAALDAGALVVASMGPPFWTGGGHYICVYDYDATHIYANDPASSKRTKQVQTDFSKQFKQLFIFWP